MSIFRTHKSVSDRTAQDRRRHREKIEQAIKEGIHNIISEESIIGKDGKTRFRVPVKGLKEHKFIFGSNEQKNVGTAPGKEKKVGDVLARIPQKKSNGNKVGDKPGEESYDVEITLDELASYLFDDLNLPDLEKKQLKSIMSTKRKRQGHRNQGIRPRLDKKETLKRKIRRQISLKKELNEEGCEEPQESVSFNEKDLRYRHMKLKHEETASAVIFFVMDTSGSMSSQKKFLARSFFFLLYQFIRYKYEKVEVVFISHTTTASEVDEKSFFSISSSGGTELSPAIARVKQIVDERYNPNSWNIYMFHCTDGDNNSYDVELAAEATKTLLQSCQLYGYCEIIPPEDGSIGNDYSVMRSRYKKITDSRFSIVSIHKSDDVWTAFKKMFGREIH